MKYDEIELEAIAGMHNCVRCYVCLFVWEIDGMFCWCCVLLKTTCHTINKHSHNHNGRVDKKSNIVFYKIILQLGADVPYGKAQNI